MRKFFIAFIFFCSLQSIAQDSSKAKNDTNSYSGLASLNDSLNKTAEDNIFKEALEQNTRNLDSFLKQREAEKSRQKRNAFIRISLGILFLIILLVGLNRQRKKRK